MCSGGLWIKDTSTSPPELRWWYFVQDTGYTVSVNAYQNLYNAILKHCQANNVTPPAVEEVVKFVCDNITVECRCGRDLYSNRFTDQQYIHPDWRPVAPPEWPLWVKVISKVKSSEDKGVGDTVARVIGPSSSRSFKEWHLKLLGRPCGCTDRQNQWNTQYGYN